MNKLLLFLVGFAYCLFISCKKQNEWLDIPKDPNDKTLKSLKDFQAVLDRTVVLNSNYPSIGQLGCDHYYLNDQYYSFTAPIEKNAYLWKVDIFEGRLSTDYTDGYQKIGFSNIVLDGLKEIKIGPSEQIEFNNIKGQALFFRSICFFELASIFSKPYVNQTASTDLGLSLKLSSDIYEIEQRSSLESTYKQIIDDLSTASLLLPIQPKYKTRPSKIAAYALLARVYLNKGDFIKAKEFSDSVLIYNPELLNFNSDIPSLALEYRFPDFKTDNKEVIFYSEGIGYTGIIPDYNFSFGLVDTVLFRSYDEYDLRRKYFYEQQGPIEVKYRGAYTGATKNFCGLALNEVYITRAECNARMNNIQAALDDLNFLLSRRYETGKFVNYYTNNVDTLLQKILTERKKELPFTAQIRWQDLRRLNIDPRFATYLTRIIGGQAFTLAPDDPKYVYPIPQNEIDRTGIVQNER
ncbi:RagB/SusD family nutrient uptake outer membrane protein [Chitinophaga sp. 22620]|uniref:RagB/SusD family nutrient uptake outer membrane protein n=1 Tax=Chitinophaga sp. 22620 TaxID=3453952 RepID=UPI003F84E292